VSRNTILGLLLGLVIGIALALALERLDPRIRRPEELAGIFGLPLLGVVPDGRSGRLLRKRRGAIGTATGPATLEVFNLIRAHVRLLRPGSAPQTLVMVSAERGEGKTALARGLAEAAASVGQRALLVEADLRAPALAAQLGTPSRLGLVQVLSGQASLSEATQTLAFAPATGSPARTLDVLTAGSLSTQSPAELLAGESMRALIEAARARYDLVVLDSSALTEFSDAFSLLRLVDGVIVAGRVAHTRRDTATSVHGILLRASASPLGVIVSAPSARTTGAGAPAPAPAPAEATPAPGGSQAPHLSSSAALPASSNGTAPAERVTTAGV
jgi:receptor protein-tyrosine kinase